MQLKTFVIQHSKVYLHVLFCEQILSEVFVDASIFSEDNWRPF